MFCKCVEFVLERKKEKKENFECGYFIVISLRICRQLLHLVHFHWEQYPILTGRDTSITKMKLNCSLPFWCCCCCCFSFCCCFLEVFVLKNSTFFLLKLLTMSIHDESCCITKGNLRVCITKFVEYANQYHERAFLKLWMYLIFSVIYFHTGKMDYYYYYYYYYYLLL